MTVPLVFRQVDVFADRPFTGNGLIVFFGGTTGIADEALLAMTAEMRQFESVFLDSDGERVRARIFTADEELPFAGHPVIGAAAALHERHAVSDPERSWTFRVADRGIEVRSRRSGLYFHAEMNQGRPVIGPPLESDDARRLARAVGLGDGDLHRLPMQVISTGLPYLIVPVARGLDRARISVPDLEDQLASVGAKFVYVLDPSRREGRTWDNAGVVEDVATGSAGGPAAAYLVAHGLALPHQPVVIEQGRFVGRPSSIAVSADPAGDLWVGGPVAPVGRGVIHPPATLPNSKDGTDDQDDA